MATITITTDTINNYRGTETAPLLRYILNKNIVASDGDILPKSAPEEGDFYLQVTCAAVANIVTYPEHTIDSTEDATPDDAGYTVGLYTAAGALIQILFRRLAVPATPTPTTLAAIVAANQEDDEPTIPVTPTAIINGAATPKITAQAAEPSSPSVGQVWIETD